MRRIASGASWAPRRATAIIANPRIGAEFGEIPDSSDCTSPDGAVRFGAGLFAATFNDYMDRIGLDPSVVATRLEALG